MAENGWEFTEYEGSIPDTLNGAQFLHQIYTAAKEDYTGRVTVPVLWDKHKKALVNNESSEIIRMLNFYPAELRDEIDRINEFVYANINNGVYRCGFATTQEAYEEAFGNLFNTLDQIENLLSEHRYLVGERITEADWRLFTTLLRFDSVYYTHFKCNLRRIEEYPNLSNYLKDLYQYPGVIETVNFKHIKEHYFKSHTSINPSGIVPGGPDLDLSTPHNRG